MSTYFLPDKPIEFKRIERMRSIVHKTDDAVRGESVCLESGDFVWAYRTDKGFAVFAAYGHNAPWSVFDAIEKKFKVAMIEERYRKEFERAKKQSGWA